MADPRYSHPDFGTREEDWPDPDVDSDTEEGRESIQRSEAAFIVSMNRSIARRNQQQQLMYPAIPQALYEKARHQQSQLTDEERHLLLSRGDLVGKALVSPDSLTTHEIHEILNWPPPSVVRADIERATGGTLSTPAELYAKAKDAIDRGQLEALLSEDEIMLLSRHFHAEDSTTGSRWAAICAPGGVEAIVLLESRLGLDIVVVPTCRRYASEKFMRERPKPDPEFANEIHLARDFLLAQRHRGLISGQEAIADDETHLRAYGHGLEANSPIRSPIPEALRKQMTISMKSLREQHLLGNITDQDAIVRSREFLVSVRAAYESEQSQRV
jgi:hypothetical protein